MGKFPHSMSDIRQRQIQLSISGIDENWPLWKLADEETSVNKMHTFLIGLFFLQRERRCSTECSSKPCFFFDWCITCP